MPTPSVRHCFFRDAILDPTFDGIIWFSFLVLNDLVTCTSHLVCLSDFPCSGEKSQKTEFDSFVPPNAVLCGISDALHAVGSLKIVVAY